MVLGTITRTKTLYIYKLLNTNIMYYSRFNQDQIYTLCECIVLFIVVSTTIVMALSSPSSLRADLSFTTSSFSYTIGSDYYTRLGLSSKKIYIDGVHSVSANGLDSKICNKGGFLINSNSARHSQIQALDVSDNSNITVFSSDALIGVYIDTGRDGHADYVFEGKSIRRSFSSCYPSADLTNTLYVHTRSISHVILHRSGPTEKIMDGIRVDDVDFPNITPQSFNKHSIATGSPLTSGRVELPSVNDVERLRKGTYLDLEVKDASLTGVSIYDDSLTASISGTFYDVQVLKGNSSDSLFPSLLVWAWHNENIYIIVLFTSSAIIFLLEIFNFYRE